MTLAGLTWPYEVVSLGWVLTYVYLKGTSKKVVGGCCPLSLRAIDLLLLYNIKAIDSTFSLGLWDWSAKYPGRYKKWVHFWDLLTAHRPWVQIEICWRDLTPHAQIKLKPCFQIIFYHISEVRPTWPIFLYNRPISLYIRKIIIFEIFWKNF